MCLHPFSSLLIADYAVSVWCPYKKGDIEDIEKIQKRATKLIISKKIIVQRSTY